MRMMRSKTSTIFVSHSLEQGEASRLKTDAAALTASKMKPQLMDTQDSRTLRDWQMRYEAPMIDSRNIAAIGITDESNCEYFTVKDAKQRVTSNGLNWGGAGAILNSAKVRSHFFLISDMWPSPPIVGKGLRVTSHRQ